MFWLTIVFFYRHTFMPKTFQFKRYIVLQVFYLIKIFCLRWKTQYIFISIHTVSLLYMYVYVSNKLHVLKPPFFLRNRKLMYTYIFCTILIYMSKNIFWLTLKHYKMTLETRIHLDDVHAYILDVIEYPLNVTANCNVNYR